MFSNIQREKLVELGSRFRAMYLLEQAGYTLGIAVRDGKAIEDLLPENFLNEVEDLVEKVRCAMQDKELMKAEAREATQMQNFALEKAKVWRRKVVRRALRASRLGEEIPEDLLSIGRTNRIPEIQGQVEVMMRLFEENISKMHGKGIDVLLKEGKEILNDLRSADADQEVKRLRALPDSVQDFYEKKGLLYLGLKVINDTGHEFFADNSEMASRYNPSILHRSPGQRKKQEENKSEDTGK